MAPPTNALHANFDVDYVITYRFHDTTKEEASASFQNLVQALARVGLAVEVRNGENCSLLVFVKVATDERLNNAVYRSRVRDWLYGVRAAQPDRETQNLLTRQPLTEAERYRIVHHMITSPTKEGGAGIIPKHGQWKDVESIFPLHDHAFNKEWIKTWSTMTFLKIEDLDDIRNRFGEKIAYYFAFTQSYFSFLIFPAAFGFSAWVLLGHFSPIYAVINCLWSVTFVEYWKRQEVDLSVRWGVKGVSAIQEKRREFQHEKEVKDPITGETVQIFPATKRLGRQLLQLPFAILASIALGTIIATCFGIEIFLSEVYNGPFKSVLVYVPTLLLTGLVPTITTTLTEIATRLNDYENWETTDAYDSAMTQKIFILNFITSYLPIFLTAFVYVPFGSVLVPYLDIFQLTARPFAENEKQLATPKAGFVIDPARLRKQVIYFTVTAQIVNFAMETIVPYIKRRGFHKYQEIKTERAAKKGGAKVNAEDIPEEADFLARVRSEAELDVYDVATDLREMVVQFGYLSLFSVVWPLTAVSFLVNNWIELRSDAVKICVEMQRPTPFRADSIGPWLDSLGFLTWTGSISSAALVYLFSNDGLGPDGTPADLKGWALLLTIFLSEHIYLAVRLIVRLAISKIDSPGMQSERAERFMVRKRYFQESFGEDAMELPPPMDREKITRATLEEEARQSSMKSYGPQDHFWNRQRSWEESAEVGAGLIEKMAPAESKKQQ
ncbi:anoctamin-10, partial [Lecanoromycetidae sp. Uapishka_2]